MMYLPNTTNLDFTYEAVILEVNCSPDDSPTALFLEYCTGWYRNDEVKPCAS